MPIDLKIIKEYIKEQKEENLILEFKTIQNDDLGNRLDK